MIRRIQILKPQKLPTSRHPCNCLGGPYTHQEPTIRWEALPRIASGFDSKAIPPLQQLLSWMWSMSRMLSLVSPWISLLLPLICSSSVRLWNKVYFMTPTFLDQSRKEIKTHSIILNLWNPLYSIHSIRAGASCLPTEAVGKKVLFSPAKGAHGPNQSIKAANQGNSEEVESSKLILKTSMQ